MSKEESGKSKKSDPKKRNIIIAGALVVLLVAAILTQMTKPQRSATAYCKIYKQEKARLSAMSDNSNPYPSGVFNVNVTDAGQIATSFSKLSPVAPKEIESQVKDLQKLYQDIHDNPSHLISNSLNGGALDDSLKDWTQQHCPMIK
jgi:cytochrome c556